MKNRESRNEKSRAWRANNIDKSRSISKAYKNNNKDKVNAIGLRLNRKSRELLLDHYLKSLLKHDGFNGKTIKAHPELIELKRLTLKFKRL